MNSLLNGKFREWKDLIEQSKMIFNWPIWKEISVVQTTKKQAASSGRKPFRSDAAERTELLIQLQDANNLSIEGVRVRICAWTNRPREEQMNDITATLEVLSSDRWVCISRIDFHPTAPHSNINWRQINIAPEVNGSHIHSFYDNVKSGEIAFAPKGNLPNAVALEEEPESFRQICQEIGNQFGISDMDNLPSPNWKGSLV